MLLWGYHGLPGEETYLTHTEAKKILESAKATSDLPAESRWFDFLQPELKYLELYQEKVNQVATARSKYLVESHERFSKAVGGSRYKIVTPVLPMDVMGMYIIVPESIPDRGTE